MASTPTTGAVVFKKKGRANTQRLRAIESEEPKEIKSQEVVEEEESSGAFAHKLKNKKKSKQKSKLTFGGDGEEEEDVPQVKKSKNLSLSVALNLEQVSSSSNTPRYDQAYLTELKASTLSTRPPPVTNALDESQMSIDPPESIADILRDAQITDETGAEVSAFVMPSESSIKVAKDRRRRVQKTGMDIEEEYISLAVVRKADEYKGPHPESRLMREDDELGEGDDEFAEYTSAQERIALGKKSRKAEAKKRRADMMELIDDAAEGDEETMEWEQEQLRRGGHEAPEPLDVASKQIYRPAPIPASAPIPTLGPAIARLATELSHLTTSHVKNTTTLNKLAQEREELDNREKDLRESISRAEEKRAWFRDFHEWVEAVAGFLDEKYPLLEKLEEDEYSLLKERFDMIATRRRQDDADDLATFLGLLPTPPLENEDASRIDELGREIPKLPPSVERIKRRANRLARRERRKEHQPEPSEDEEGYSTDSSLPPNDQQAYIQALRSLEKDRKGILADVKAEEFRDPGKGKWSTWRLKYTDDYVKAWGGLGVVSVWEFWTRLELLGWNCIMDPRSLDSFKWYQGLYEYSRPGDGDVAERALGSDGDLVASMISTSVIPRVCKLIEGGALDVYSEGHIRRIINLAEEVEASIEGENARYQTLLKSVYSRFQAAVNDTKNLVAEYRGINHGRVPFNPEAIPARRRFLVRRVKLLKNIHRWKKHTGDVFGIGRLIDSALNECSLIDIMQEGWDVGGMEVAQSIATIAKDALPADWLKILALVQT